MAAAAKLELLGLTVQQLTDLALSAGQPAYRGRQLFDALYRQRVTALDEMTPLPASWRAELAQTHEVGVPKAESKFTSVDGTIRYLFAFSDGQSVETVWMPEGDGGESGDGSEAGDGRDYDRATICVSSQVGCAVDCRFCLTAQLKVRRNLSAGEIVGQVIGVLNERGVNVASQRINLVFMGQGEPFLNYDNWIQAVRLLVEGVGIPESRMTVSTSGIVPRIYDYAAEPVRPKLAISLNAPNDELRTAIMPLNKKWDIAQLMAAVREFPLRNREKVTFEYVLLSDVNDSAEHARGLAELVRGIGCKVNLIALNPGPGIDFRTPADARVDAFQQILIQSGIPAFVRRPRGRDIYAACGQLKRTTEQPIQITV